MFLATDIEKTTSRRGPKRRTDKFIVWLSHLRLVIARLQARNHLQHHPALTSLFNINTSLPQLIRTHDHPSCTH